MSQRKLTVLAYFPVTEDFILLLDKRSWCLAARGMQSWIVSMVNSAVLDSFLQGLLFSGGIIIKQGFENRFPSITCVICLQTVFIA